MSLFGWFALLMGLLQVFAWGAFLWNLWGKRYDIASKFGGNKTTNNFYVKSNNTQINSDEGTIRVDKHGT